MHEKVKLTKNIIIDLFWRTDNLIIENLLQVVNYIKSNTGLENKKNLYFNQLIN